MEIAQAGGGVYLTVDKKESTKVGAALGKHRALPRTRRRALHKYLLRKRIQWVLYNHVQSYYLQDMVACGPWERASKKDEIVKMVGEACMLNVDGHTCFEEQDNPTLSEEYYATYQQDLTDFAVADYRKFRRSHFGCMRSCAKHLNWKSYDDLMRAMQKLPPLDDHALHEELTDYEKAVSICCYTDSQINFSRRPRKQSDDRPSWSCTSHAGRVLPVLAGHAHWQSLTVLFCRPQESQLLRCANAFRRQSQFQGSATGRRGPIRCSHEALLFS